MQNTNLYMNVDEFFQILECIREANKGKRVYINKFIDEIIETTHDMDWIEIEKDKRNKISRDI